MNIAFYIRHMKNIHINSLDLKLLKVFRAVFEEGSVTKAAARLSLEQSQISHLLNRLRKTLGDPLFVRSGRSIAPTERAIVIAPSVQAIIEQIESLGETAALDLSVLTDTFTISANDYERRLLAPHLAECFFTQAPRAKLVFAHTSGSIEERLRSREWDVVISPRSLAGVHDIHSRKLFEDVYACFFDGAILDARTVRQSYGEQLHAIVRFEGNPPSPVDTVLSAMGLKRDVRLVAPSFEALPALLAGQPLVATLPSRLAKGGFEHFVRTDLPFASPRLSFQMIWHSATHHSPKHKWFRDLLAKSVGQIRSTSR